MTKEELVTIAKRMPADDRAFIVAALDPAEDADGMTDALKIELDRRLALIDSDPSQLVTREQFDALVAARVAEARAVGR